MQRLAGRYGTHALSEHHSGGAHVRPDRVQYSPCIDSRCMALARCTPPQLSLSSARHLSKPNLSPSADRSASGERGAGARLAAEALHLSGRVEHILNTHLEPAHHLPPK